MSEQAKHQAAQERRIFLAELTRRILIVAVGVYMLVTTAVITIIAIQNYHGNRVIKDCVQPKGECYKRSLAARAQLTTDINNNSAAAAACAVSAPFDAPYLVRYRVIKKCIEHTLKDGDTHDHQTS